MEYVYIEEEEEEEQDDDLPDLICEECGCVVGWDNVCICNE